MSKTNFSMTSCIFEKNKEIEKLKKELEIIKDGAQTKIIHIRRFFEGGLKNIFTVNKKYKCIFLSFRIFGDCVVQDINMEGILNEK